MSEPCTQRSYLVVVFGDGGSVVRAPYQIMVLVAVLFQSRKS